MLNPALVDLMRSSNLKRFVALAALVITAGLTLSCGDDSGDLTGESAEPAPTPNIEATVQAEVAARLNLQGLDAGTPTPLPVEVSQRIQDFATRYGQIGVAWDDVSSAFDSWRNGLTACSPVAVRAALNEFTSIARAVHSQSLILPRDAGLSPLANRLAEGAQIELDALRALRDGWSPGEVELFNQVESSMATVRAILVDTRDILRVRQERIQPGAVTSLSAFKFEIDRLNERWDQFRRDYDAFRSREVSQELPDTLKDLSSLVAQIRDLAIGLRQLEADESTRDVANILAQAAEREELSLRSVREEFQSSASSVDPGVGSSQVDRSLLGEFDTQAAASNTARREAAMRLTELLDQASEESQAAVGNFTQQASDIISIFDGFHARYGEWRRTEGGCDRLVVVEALGRFASDLSAVALSVRTLPGGDLLGSLRELTIEALEIEIGALRRLRDQWQPFDNSVYGDLDLNRITSSRLRRQVETGLDSIVTEYGISLP